MWRATAALRQQQGRRISIAQMLQLNGNDRSTSRCKQFLGRSVSGKLCTEANVLEEVIVCNLMEGVCILICNFACSNWNQSHARIWFPRGAHVTIREPVLSFAADGTPCLEVMNPACIHITGMDNQYGFKTGVDAFLSGDFIKAGHVFRHSGALVDACQAWLAAGLVDNTILDASTALTPSRSISESERDDALTSKGMALMKMQEFRSAYRCFQDIVKTDGGDRLRDRCRIMLEWSERGPSSSELEGYYLSRESNAPECPDFVGPVDIRLCPYGKGRGLFATEDVKAGDIIFTCNPLVSLTDSDNIPSEHDMVATLVRNCLSSRRCLEQLLCLVESQDIPDLGLLKPNSNWTAGTVDDEFLVDVPSFASRTSTNYGYKFERLVGKNRRREYLSGLWVLTAFANHSCEPNASQRAVGAVSLVRAGRDIKQGEEITLPYLDPLQPWEVRSMQTRNKWGFDCACERCNFEKQLHADSKSVFAGVAAKMDKLGSDFDIFELSQMACRIEALVRGLSDKEKFWVRSSYYRAYEVYLLNHKEFKQFSSSSMRGLSWGDLMEALHNTAAGYEGLLTILLAFARHEHHRGCNRARDLVTRESVSCFGKLTPQALESILSFAQDIFEDS